MTPITTDRAAIHDARELLKLDQRQLDELFAASPVGDIPVGRGEGIAMIANGTAFGTVCRTLISALIWKGKLFRPATSDLKNRLTPFGIPGIRARVYVDKSWKTGSDAIILDYSKSSIVARFVRDEIREIGPGIYLGKVFLGRKHVFDFSLTFR
jgi:hypothetical protein